VISVLRPLRRGLLFIACLLPSVAAAADIPALKARVTDVTGTLNGQQSAALEQTLAEFEARKGAQIAVLLVPTSQPETIEQYAVRVFESWKLGRKGVDDGALLVIAKNDRKLHIEVGYGLEGILPDAVAKRIIDDDIVPRFKQGDFYGGIRAGLDRMMRIVEGEKLPPPIARKHPVAEHFDPESWIGLLFVGLILGSMMRPFLGRFLSSGIVRDADHTMGEMVRVACIVGSTASEPLARITSGASAISSATCWRICSAVPAPRRKSIFTLRPSSQPSFCSPSWNATMRACAAVSSAPW